MLGDNKDLWCRAQVVDDTESVISQQEPEPVHEPGLDDEADVAGVAEEVDVAGVAEEAESVETRSSSASSKIAD